MYQGERIQLGHSFTVSMGSASSWNGEYGVYLGRGMNGNGSTNTLIGYGHSIQHYSNRECIAMGSSNTFPDIGHRYPESTQIFGAAITARMRGALHTHKINFNQLPGQWVWSTSSNSYVQASGYANDNDFYTNYVGRDGTLPSGATAGSVYSQPGGNLMIAGSGGYNYLDPSLNYADDAAASSAGVAIGQMYHTNGVVKVRIV